MEQLSQFLSANPWFFAFAIPAVIVTGLSKGGFGGSIAMLGTPILALTMPPIQAAAVLLPVLLFMDLIGLLNYRGKVKWSIIRSVIPACAVGITIGALTASYVSDDFIRILVGLVAISFALNLMLRDFLKFEKQEESLPRATFWGTIAGFTSFISHAGGPPYQAYTLGLKLDKILFAGTSVYAFAMINAMKTLPYFLLGQFNSENLAISAILLPIAVTGVMLGVWAVKHVSQTFFYNFTYVAMFVVGTKLLWDGRLAIANLFNSLN